MRYGDLRYWLVTGFLVAMLVAACSAESSNGASGTSDFNNGEAGNSGLDDGYGTGGLDDGYGTSGSSGSTGGGSSGSTAGSQGSMDPDVICAGKKVDPVPVEIEIETLVPYEVLVPSPIAVYIMQDKSGSMNDGNPRKWDVAIDAITTFVNDPDSAFIHVALQYFSGDGGWGGGGTVCDGAVYSAPAVPLGPLPDNAINITNSLATISPNGNTPLEGALRGATQFCVQYKAQNPDGMPCVAVLITDGRPTSCNQQSSALVNIAQEAYDNNHIRTFTVGMQGDTDFVLLNDIAMWGGSDCTPNDPSTYACDVRPGSGVTLLEAFENIREVVTTLEERTETRVEIITKISECDWGRPDPPEGETFDKDMVNVIFSQPDEADMTIPRVDDPGDCVNVDQGWYYDDPNNPTKLIACEQTCNFITSVEGGVIDIQFGCETKVAILE
jgi:hypothetical protein